MKRRRKKTIPVSYIRRQKNSPYNKYCGRTHLNTLLVASSPLIQASQWCPFVSGPLDLAASVIGDGELATKFKERLVCKTEHVLRGCSNALRSIEAWTHGALSFSSHTPSAAACRQTRRRRTYGRVFCAVPLCQGPADSPPSRCIAEAIPRGEGEENTTECLRRDTHRATWECNLPPFSRQLCSLREALHM